MIARYEPPTGNSFTPLRVVVAIVLGLGIVVWDQNDGDQDLPIFVPTIIALAVVYGVSELIWILRKKGHK